MPIPSSYWPVYGFNERGFPEFVATFFDWSSSVDFIQHPTRYGCEQRNLYQGDPYTRKAA